ncbi:ATP-dependent RNA helicase DDX50-like [Rhinopithecus roxellana]|uniref:ATP-dependent RNA helicase DDX50-like n=1 Tax=Rhinopithecus roxellana TaxID=61622 RepID=UPI0012372656|nr:ATP-dependent RNA helicase DDX50-like [Rhinopithecus roxellana]
MPGKLLWGDIMELEAPLAESESQKKERQKTLTREQKEGAFSNFPVSEETIKLLKAFGHPVSLVSEAGSYWRCPSSLQWV